MKARERDKALLKAELALEALLECVQFPNGDTIANKEALEKMPIMAVASTHFSLEQLTAMTQVLQSLADAARADLETEQLVQACLQN